jgi:hypothetical protein
VIPSDHVEVTTKGISSRVGSSDVPALLGLKAPAWAWLLGARAQELFEPGREPSEPWAKPKPEA